MSPLRTSLQMAYYFVLFLPPPHQTGTPEKALIFSSLLEVSAVTVRFEVKVRNQPNSDPSRTPLSAEMKVSSFYKVIYLLALLTLFG